MLYFFITKRPLMGVFAFLVVAYCCTRVYKPILKFLNLEVGVQPNM